MYSSILLFLIVLDLLRNICCKFHYLVQISFVVKHGVISHAEPQELSETIQTQKLTGNKFTLIQFLPELPVLSADVHLQRKKYGGAYL